MKMKQKPLRVLLKKNLKSPCLKNKKSKKKIKKKILKKMMRTSQRPQSQLSTLNTMKQQTKSTTMQNLFKMNPKTRRTMKHGHMSPDRSADSKRREVLLPC